MAENEIDYLRRRAAEELAAAGECADPAAANIHRSLAALYSSKIDELIRARGTEAVRPNA